MKIICSSLKENETSHFVDDIDFSNQEINYYSLRKILNCHVEADVTDYEEFLRIELHIISDVIGICSYSLEDVPLHLDFIDELDFSSNDEDVEDCIINKNNIIELDQYIYSLIISELPTKIVKKGKSLPKSGKNYDVMSEKEYYKKKEESKDSRWDKLDDLKL